ncbi:MAG: histidine ammonia-lyase [Myxococcota bacterium]
MIILDGQSLSLKQLKEIACHKTPIQIAPHCLDKIANIRLEIDLKASGSKAYYGINTGFGALSETKISTEDLEKLQRNLILSHAVGVGEPLSEAETRALMLLRLNTLAKGFSGVRPLILERLAALLNRNLLPQIPRKGSVGASGDLAPLAHLAMFLMKDHEGVEAFELHAKEGLALINGTQAMTAVGCLAQLEAESLSDFADQIGSLSLDVLLGSDAPMDNRIHEARPHPGQIQSAKRIKELLGSSELNESHRYCRKVQDAYSLRCMPQVHGATRDVLQYTRSVLEREINSATDNPLVFENHDILSGGNFHGQPVAFALDFLGIATAELANISERRMEQMLNPMLSSGLPAFLTPNPGLNSGMMMLQVTAAALINENKVLSHPASTDSIPTSANREDHVSMGMTSANKARTIVDNVCHVLAIELLCAAQALDLRRPLKSSSALEALHESFRQHVSFAEVDRAYGIDLAKSVQYLKAQVNA